MNHLYKFGLVRSSTVQTFLRVPILHVPMPEKIELMNIVFHRTIYHLFDCIAFLSYFVVGGYVYQGVLSNAHPTELVRYVLFKQRLPLFEDSSSTFPETVFVVSWNIVLREVGHLSENKMQLRPIDVVHVSNNQRLEFSQRAIQTLRLGRSTTQRFQYTATGRAHRNRLSEKLWKLVCQCGLR